MNAVPNSLPNRYHHVKDVTLEDNRFINCDNILFCVGKDNERTLPPSNISFIRNQFISKSDKALYQSFDDISGFTFIDNVVNYPYTVTQRGFQNNTTLLDSIDLKPYMEKKLGASWYTFSENHN